MKRELAPVAALLIGVSILLTDQGLQGTLLPVRASLEGFSTLLIGTIGAAYFLGFTFGCLKGVETCSECGGEVRIAVPAHPCAHGISASMHVIVSIEDPEVIRKILAHLDEKITLTGTGMLPETRAPPAAGFFV